MLFCSQQFLIFFCLVFATYWALPWQRARTLLLLAASYYFYFSWSQALACVVCASSLLDWVLARGLEKAQTKRRKKLFLTTSIVANLSLLCYFKYANFFLESLEAALRHAGLSASLPLLEVLLPIGISFYTFEAINYMVDVYRGHVRAERDPTHFLLFILFFPHLVAGPIVRSRDFLPQIRRKKHWNWLRMEVGVRLFLMGLFKKLAIADTMARFADPIFEHPGAFGSMAVWVGVLAYAVQIYCDFSGYTDMALGTAHLFGFHLAKNFDMPYLARNIAEFWRRWHISLSTWLRDYLFIPLGGSRGSRWLIFRNLLITMTLGGLWHGANWTFVLWGVAHGLLLIGHRLFQGWCADRPLLTRLLDTWPGHLLRMTLTFLAVCGLWVLFRAPTLDVAATLLQRMVRPVYGLGPFLDVNLFLGLIAVVIGCHLLASQGLWQRTVHRLPAPVLGGGYAVAMTLALFLAPEGTKPFIYFQF